MPGVARDLKFESALAIDKSYRDLPLSAKTPSVKKVAEAFVANLDRAVALIEFAPLALGYSQHLQLKLAARNHPQSAALQASSGAVEPALTGPPQHARITDAEKAEQERTQNLDAGLEELSLWIRVHPEVPLGIEAVLAAQVTLALTAFETLSKDLWKAAVKAKPSVTPTPKGLFASLEKAKETYRKTFPTIWAQVQVILDRQEIVWLAKLRNNLVHNAGIADPQFVTAFANHPELHRVKEGDPVPLDGSLVAFFITAVVDRGPELLTAVSALL